MSDYSKVNLYEVSWRDDGWHYEVYHWDASGNDVTVMATDGPFKNDSATMDAALAWCEQKGIGAQLVS